MSDWFWHRESSQVKRADRQPGQPDAEKGPQEQEEIAGGMTRRGGKGRGGKGREGKVEGTDGELFPFLSSTTAVLHVSTAVLQVQPPLLRDPGWVFWRVVVEDGGPWGRRQKPII